MVDKPDGFDWDDEKFELNLREHRVDFRRAPEIFAGPFLLRPASRHGEHRLIAIGLLRDREVTVVFTMRDGKRRIISIRRARTDERQALQDAIHRLRPKR